MSAGTLAFLIVLATMTVAVGQLCFFAHDVSSAAKRMRRRVDLLPVGRRASDQVSGRRSTLSIGGRTVGRRDSDRVSGRRSNPGVPSRLATSTLRGDDLEFARWLAPLHIAPDQAPRLFLILRLSAGVLLALAVVQVTYRYTGLGASPSLVGLGLVGAGLGWYLPHVAMGRSALNRMRSIARGLPDAIELLVIAVEAGLSLEDGMNRIVVELRGPLAAIADELALTSADMKILPSRDDALHRLAERVNLPSVRSAVITLTQTLRYGTPLAQALRVIAAELRNDALIKLEEQANRMPVMLTIPMILFILPSLFLVIGGPAAVKVLDVISGMK
jgi:tight adherence protein C